MTNRIAGLTVTLQADIRDDDAQPIIDAILLLKGVVSVKTHVADMEHNFALQQALHELRQQMQDVLWPKQTEAR